MSIYIEHTYLMAGLFMEELREKPMGGAIFMNQVIDRTVPEGSNSTGGASCTDRTSNTFTPEGFASMEEGSFLQLCLLDEEDFRRIYSHYIFHGIFF